MGLIRALQKEGHQIHAIAPMDEYSDYLVAGGCEYHPITMDNSGSHPARELRLFWQLYKLYRRLQPDIVLHYTIKPNIYGSWAARLLGIKMINNVSGLGTTFLQPGLVSMAAKSLYRWTFRYPDKVFFQNQDDYDLFTKKNLISADRAEIIPGSGINTRRFKPGSQKQDQTFTFLLISRLLVDKGILEYVAAIKILKDRKIKARFLLLGAAEFEHRRGIGSAKLENWVNEGILEYLGAVVDVRPFIEQADCVVLPSYREGLPKSLLEAASMEKPLIASDVAGCREVVIDQVNGLLCRVKDPDDLAKKMTEMIGMDEVVMKNMGIKGRKIVDTHFNEDIIIRKYLESIESLIEPKSEY